MSRSKARRQRPQDWVPCPRSAADLAGQSSQSLTARPGLAARLRLLRRGFQGLLHHRQRGRGDARGPQASQIQSGGAFLGGSRGAELFPGREVLVHCEVLPCVQAAPLTAPSALGGPALSCCEPHWAAQMCVGTRHATKRSVSLLCILQARVLLTCTQRTAIRSAHKERRKLCMCSVAQPASRHSSCGLALVCVCLSCMCVLRMHASHLSARAVLLYRTARVLHGCCMHLQSQATKL